MLQRLKCLFGQHIVVCAQTYVIGEGANYLEHMHACPVCGKHKEFENEPIESNELDLLMQATGAGKYTTRLTTDPPSYIH